MCYPWIRSDQISHSVVSNSLQPHESQHTRLLCPPLSPRVCSDSCLLSQWCYLTISFSAAPFSFCLQSFPATGSFPSELVLCIRRPRYWSFSFSISPFNEYSGLFSYRIDCFDLLTVQRTVLLNSYLGIIFIFLIIPVVLGCHPLLILLWCVTLFVGPKRNHIPQSNPPHRINTLHPLSDGDAVCYPHAFGSWFSRCRLWPVDLLEQIT